MDWSTIERLLNIIHMSQNLPEAKNIRRKAMEELRAWNTEEPIVEPSKPSVEPDLLTYGARRL